MSDAILGEQLAESSDFIAAIDQGTTSTRCMIFDHHGAEVARHQLEHEQILPRAGWVEHNPVEIWERTASVLISVLNATNLSPKDIAALGITNQRETTLVWNRHTGRPYYNAIVWQDTRTDRIASALDRDGRGNLIRRALACRRQLISLAASCSGSWKMSMESARPPRTATHCSAHRTPGCCGI